MPKSEIQVSVVIPLNNEHWAIYPLLGKLRQLISASPDIWEIIFVDDGSTDNTWSVLGDILGEIPHAKCIRFRKNFGVTQAIQAGFDHARGRYIVTISGNLQNDPKDIPRLLSYLDQGYDVCVGWRSSQEGVLARQRPNKLLNWAISKISGITLHDYECMLRAYRRELLEGLAMYGQLDRYIPVYISWRGGRIAEVPVAQHPKSHGHGYRGNRTKRTIKTIFDLILLKYLERFSTRPFYLFGSLSLVSLVLSVLSFTMMTYLKIFQNEAFIGTPLPLVTVLFFLSGVLLGMLGIIAEMLSRILMIGNQRRLYEIKERVGFD